MSDRCPRPQKRHKVRLDLISYGTTVVLIHRVMRRRRHLDQIFENASTTKSRFARLTILLCTFVAITLPIHSIDLYKCISLAVAAGTFYAPSPMRGIILSITPPHSNIQTRWVIIASAYLVIAFLGSGRDARMTYRDWFRAAVGSRYCPSASRLRQYSPKRSSWSPFGSRAKVLLSAGKCVGTSSSLSASATTTPSTLQEFPRR